MPTTHPDQDKLADVVSVDDHARSLVGEKAKRDMAPLRRGYFAPIVVTPFMPTSHCFRTGERITT
jgi:hypothetical protein